MVGSYWLPIGNQTLGIQWSHDRWRHVTQKVKVVTPIHLNRNISITVRDRRSVLVPLKLNIQYITSCVRPLWWSLVIVRDNYSCLVIFVCVSLEQPESEIPAVVDDCVLAIDCSEYEFYSEECIEYRDNATSMPRWLIVYGQIYSFFEKQSVRCIRILTTRTTFGSIWK